MSENFWEIFLTHTVCVCEGCPVASAVMKLTCVYVCDIYVRNIKDLGKVCICCNTAYI